ncbi:MAG: hypothetical protein ACHQFX_07445 [Chitinophagales bacterium]
MPELFRRYLDNKCSPDEARKLLAFFNIDENEIVLAKLIIEWLEENAGYPVKGLNRKILVLVPKTIPGTQLNRKC